MAYIRNVDTLIISGERPDDLSGEEEEETNDAAEATESGAIPSAERDESLCNNAEDPSEECLKRRLLSIIPEAVGGVVGGLTLGPVVVATVQAVGFTSSGILAGSSAAGMMASAALAGGGAVAAGSTVAALQSLGALGVAGCPLVVTGILLGCGAVVARRAFYRWILPWFVCKQLRSSPTNCVSNSPKTSSHSSSFMRNIFRTRPS
eukprot:GHVS01071432.1.p1 GENE.GHVS01071432.1~~GHVS01071432.1.p1  ORF type:complete len:206 (+),score=28.62 GHVS01071432.1:193-810(+)